ncbi:thioredoxin [[Clostridium] sordellii]|uniref:Thioredoxin n=1 Tax=Paraclostridium sordellii TaxID=1505 RepID=A0A9P1L3X8_PARSO|nr:MULTISPECIES: thioredoxin [Paeniclostridium]AUN13154.1 thiol reductase thioredoxin [Paeniclostridium sordellii]EPZ61825.1 thioredoxin [[Clostridium] sordellii VPI 9048] [Paeniclostridium sordellii VPI 9048]MBS6025677.1 thioredoxin [Paeniclostridium sordellii]MBW4861442.1 thioredoxin [Paeniclostridium sp.]MBX9183134.1 thioredoxin [Paeniclostridium sordellii]
MTRIIETEEFKNEVENATETTIVDFFATWCGPCKMLSPVFEEIDQNVEEAKFLKVDIDKSLDLARRFEVTTVPTVIVFKDGKEADRLVGFIPKQKLEEMVKAHI